MRLRDADRFSAAVCTLVITDSKRLCMAPMELRSELTDDNAASTALMVALASATVSTEALLSAALPSDSELAA
jgi:hypothetical protein